MNNPGAHDNNNNNNQNIEKVVTDEMVIKHLLKPMVDAGVVFTQPIRGNPRFNPIANRGQNEANSRRFRTVLLDILDDIVQEKPYTKGNNAPYEWVYEDLMLYLDDEQTVEDAEIERLIRKGIQNVKDAVQAIRNAPIRKEERKMAGEVVVKKKLFPGLGEAIGKFLGGRRKKTRRSSKSSRKTKTRKH